MPTLLRGNCRSCSAGCGIIAEVQGSRVLSVRGDQANELSHGYLCPKGKNLPWTQHRPDRLDVPLLRGVKTPWEPFLDDLARNFEVVMNDAGPNALSWYAGTGLVSDQVGPRALGDLFSKIGSDRFYSAATIDASPALLVTELITGMSSVTPMLLAPKWDMEDPQGKLAVLFGANPAVSHGHLSSMSDPVRRMKAFMARGGQIFVVDPRRTKTAMVASHHLAIAPGTDRALLAYLLREVLRTGLVSEDFIEGTTPDERRRLEASLEIYDLHHTAGLTGLPESQIELVSSALLRAGTATVETGTGINFQTRCRRHRVVRWELLIVPRSLDGSGGMPISPGWFDALDLRESQFEAGTFPRGRSKTRPDLPGVGGEYAVSGMPDEIESGELQGLVVAGGNPVSSFPNPAHTIEALQSLRFLAVADVVETEATALATHVIPVAGQLESMSIMPFTRRVVVSPAMLAPAAQRKPLWWVAAQVGRRLGVDVLGISNPDDVTEADVLTSIVRLGRQDLGDLMAAGSDGIELPRPSGYFKRRVLPDGRWKVLPDALLTEWERDPGPGSGAGSGWKMVCGRQLSHNCSSTVCSRRARTPKARRYR